MWKYDENGWNGAAAPPCLRRRSAVGGAVWLGGGGRAPDKDVRLQCVGDRGLAAVAAASRRGSRVEGVGGRWQPSSDDVHCSRMEVVVRHFPNGIRGHSR